MTQPNSEPQHNTQPENQTTAPKQPKKRRWLKYTAIGAALSAVGLIGGGYWLLTSHSGLQFAVTQLPKLAGVEIDAKTLNGTIWHGFSGEGIQVKTEAADTEIQDLKLQWQANQLWDKNLHINELAIGNIRIKSKSTPPEPDKPATKLPNSISLPFTVVAEKITIGEIINVIDDDKQPENVILRGIDARYVYNHKEHILQIQSLRNEWSKSHGHLYASTSSPFALEGVLLTNGQLDNVAVENIFNISGSLQQLGVESTLTGNGVSLYAHTQLRPFEAQLSRKIDKVVLEGNGVNPQAFDKTLPFANLTFKVEVHPNHNQADNIALTGNIDLRNDNPEPADKNGIPVQLLTGSFVVDNQNVVQLGGISAKLMRDGHLTLNGNLDTANKTLNLVANAHHIIAADILAQPLKGALNGQITAKNTFDQPNVQWQLNTGFADVSGSLNIVTDTALGQRTLLIKDAQIVPKNGGKMQLSGSYELFKDQKLEAKVISENFNPNQFYPTFPVGSVNGTIDANGLAGKQQFDAQMQFGKSQLSGAELSGSAKIGYLDKHLHQADADIRLGQNRILTQGAYGKKGDTLKLDINAPELNRFGFGVQGALIAKGTLTSIADDFTKLDAKLSGSARQFAMGDGLKVQNLDFNFIGSPDPQRPLDIMLKGNSILAGGTAIDTIDAALKGTLRRHNFRANGSLKIDGKPLALNTQADGGLNDKNQWLGQIGALDVSGALDLKLQNRMGLEVGTERVVLGAAHWQALSGSLNLERLVWDKQAGLSTKGSAQSLHLVQLHNFYTPPVEHNLVLSGDWDLNYTQNPTGYLNVRQQGGDIILNDARKTPLLLNNFVLNTQLSNRGILNKFSGNTRYGKAEGNFDILQTFGGDLAQAPVTGRVLVRSENLDTLRNFMPIGQTISGTLNGDVAISGRLNNPQFSGSITGQDLNYRNRDVGIILTDGTLQSSLEGQTWIVDALTFRRKDGTVSLAGKASYATDTPDVDAKVTFNHYQILDQPNRRLTISGTSDVIYTKDGITLTGNLQTDEGRFGFQDSSAPTLDDDVIVLGESQEEPSKPLPFNLNLVFDLNDKFYFSGQGLDVTLGGQLTLKAKPGTDIQGVGSVNVVKGQYKAYGQDLTIKKGVISFVGPLNSPNLNIRAERRGSPVGAGVEVLGNLDSPRVTLVADEPMSEKDKLSWLILNRASSGSSTDEAALATAAGAFLAGSLNDKIGLVDDFGLTSQQTRNAQTGEMNPAQQVLTFGKQLTQNLYLGYEAGLQTASQSVKLVYQLTRSFQAIARAGTQSSGGEVKYIKRFD
ncbi:translocation/assembly module TamB domain-containing protein [Neisseriaceae bacterium B1]